MKNIMLRTMAGFSEFKVKFSVNFVITTSARGRGDKVFYIHTLVGLFVCPQRNAHLLTGCVGNLCTGWLVLV